MRLVRVLVPHPCDPTHVPVVEDQRVWTCPECGDKWRWTELFDGVGWARV